MDTGYLLRVLYIVRTAFPDDTWDLCALSRACRAALLLPDERAFLRDCADGARMWFAAGAIVTRVQELSAWHLSLDVQLRSLKRDTRAGFRDHQFTESVESALAHLQQRIREEDGLHYEWHKFTLGEWDVAEDDCCDNDDCEFVREPRWCYFDFEVDSDAEQHDLCVLFGLWSGVEFEPAMLDDIPQALGLDM